MVGGTWWPPFLPLRDPPLLTIQNNVSLTRKVPWVLITAQVFSDFMQIPHPLPALFLPLVQADSWFSSLPLSYVPGGDTGKATGCGGKALLWRSCPGGMQEKRNSHLLSFYFVAGTLHRLARLMWCWRSRALASGRFGADFGSAACWLCVASGKLLNGSQLPSLVSSTAKSGRIISTSQRSV